jgi:hypothetical protein
VVGVASALLVIVAAAVVATAVVDAAVAGETVVPVVAAPVVAPIVDAAVVPVVAPVVAAPPMKTPPSPAPAPLLMTGVGSELIDAFTVLCGLAYADGGITWFDGGMATLVCGPLGLTTPRNRSR